jgi:ribosomal protein L11 methyltransferase
MAPGAGGVSAKGVEGVQMFSLEIECGPEDRDFLIAELWERGSSGIVELDALRVRAFFDDSLGLETLLKMYPGSTPRVEEERDWVQEARDLLQPMEVGKRFFLVPAWRDDPAPDGRFRITVNPGLAFGTGVHETTRLCMEALEDYIKPGMKMLDVGAGSGILARSAQLLGAGQVYGCDIDETAVEIAGDSGKLERRFVGSVDAVAGGSMDLVVANISPEAAIQLAPDLLRVRREGGVLLVSGLERHEIETVKSTFPAAREVREKGNWGLIIV